MTKNTSARIVALFVIVILSIVLSACNGNAAESMMQAVVDANSNGAAPASHTSIQYNTRSADCGLGEKVQVLGAIDSDLESASAKVGSQVTELTITTDAWFNGHMKAFSCIKAAN